MKRYFYVYIPGFTYKSRGPMHVDAIRLEANIGGENNISTSVTSNTLLPYATIISDSTVVNQYEDENLLAVPCNIIYRTSELYQNNKTTDTSGDPCGINASKLYQNTRSAYGRFYDFIEGYWKKGEDDNDVFVLDPNDDGSYTHTLTFRNKKEDANSSGNLRVDDHDGLFVLKVDDLDTDINLNFTFYSRIGDAPDNSDPHIIGDEETSNTVTDSDGNQTSIFMLSDTEMLNRGYLIIGTWNTTYNPMTSVADYEPVEFTSTFTQLYYDITRNTDLETFNFDLPVNTGFLVTQNASHSDLDLATGNIITPQLKYDTDTKKFVTDSTLTCNLALDNTFFSNWYNNSVTSNLNRNSYDGRGNDLIIERCIPDTDVCDYADRYYQHVNKCIGEYISNTCTIDYNITPINLTNITYLYKTTPEIQLITLSNINNTMFQYNSKMNYLTDISDFASNQGLHDIATYDNYYINSEYPSNQLEHLYYFWYHMLNKSTAERDYTKLSLSIGQFNGDLTANDTDLISFTNSLLTGNNTSYNTSTAIHTLLGDPTGSTFLEAKNNLDITLYGKKPGVSLKYKFNYFWIPYIYFGSYKCDDPTGTLFIDYKGNTGYSFDRRSSTVNDYTPDYTKDTFPASLSVTITPATTSTYIDLSKSVINYSNKSNYQVAKSLTNDTQGFVEKSLMPSNINTTNLLDPTPTASGFEIQRIVSSTDLKTPVELGYTSTICNDVRFVSCKKDFLLSTTISTNDLTLYNGNILGATTSALTAYVFKIEDSVFGDTMFNKKEEDFEYTITINSKDYTTYHRKLLILRPANNSSSISITNISPSTVLKSTNNYISSIGLYKLDLSGTTLNTLELNDYISDKPFSNISNIEILGRKSVPQSICQAAFTPSMIDNIVFPASFVLQENIKFLPSNGILDDVKQYKTYTANLLNRSTTTRNYIAPMTFDSATVDLYNKYVKYGIDVDSDTALYKKYDFTFLPETGMYEVVGKYNITDNSGNTSNLVSKSRVVIRSYVNKDIVLLIEGNTVRK